jgi:amino acid transporter
VTTVERGLADPLGTIVALILIWFFVSNTVVYNYSFARLLFVSGLERRLPSVVGRVNQRTRVPDVAVLVQSVLASIIVLALFMRGDRRWRDCYQGVPGAAGNGERGVVRVHGAAVP